MNQLARLQRPTRYCSSRGLDSSIFSSVVELGLISSLTSRDKISESVLARVMCSIYKGGIGQTEPSPRAGG